MSLELWQDSEVSGWSLSRPMGTNERIYFFLTHSWHDDPVPKFQALTDVAMKVAENSGREPTFWFDKACINQESITDGLRCLPVNVMACTTMLMLLGPTYLALVVTCDQFRTRG